MSDVARRAGVSRSTVSRALNNHPRIPKQTRQAIQALCREMGYRPNPLVNALMASRKGTERGGADTLAFVTDYRGPKGWADKPSCVDIFRGVERRAGERGFKVEVFGLPSVNGSPDRLRRVLRARGIRGVILGFSSEHDNALAGFVCDDFAFGGLARYFQGAAVDRVMSNGLQNVRLGLNSLKALGYLKPGLVVPEANNRITGFAWTAGYLDEQRRTPARRRCQPFVSGSDRVDAGEFGKWLERTKADSLLVYKVDVVSLLGRLGFQAPRDIGVAFFYRHAGEMQAAAGVDERMEENGAAVVDLVVENLHANRYGPSEPAREILIGGQWRDGPTVRNVDAG